MKHKLSPIPANTMHKHSSNVFIAFGETTFLASCGLGEPVYLGSLYPAWEALRTNVTFTVPTPSPSF